MAGGLRAVDTFQGLGAQTWPISRAASKADWGGASIFLTGLKRHHSRRRRGRI